MNLTPLRPRAQTRISGEGRVSGTEFVARQQAFEGEHVPVVRPKTTQRFSQLSKIIRIGAAWTPGRSNLPGDIRFRRRPQIGKITDGGNVNHGRSRPGVGPVDTDGETLIAVFLAMIQMLENLRCHLVGHASADRALFGNQRDHPTRCINSAAMVMRTLPETPHPALQGGWLTPEKGKVSPEYERTVRKNPGPFPDHERDPFA